MSSQSRQRVLSVYFVNHSFILRFALNQINAPFLDKGRLAACMYWSYWSWPQLEARGSVWVAACHLVQRPELVGKSLWRPWGTPHLHTGRGSVELLPAHGLQRSAEMSHRSLLPNSPHLCDPPSCGQTQEELRLALSNNTFSQPEVKRCWWD